MKDSTVVNPLTGNMQGECNVCGAPAPVYVNGIWVCYEHSAYAEVDKLRAEATATGPERPVVVCLCGSTRFKDAYLAATERETVAGRIVLSVGCFMHADAVPISDEEKVALDELHLRKIDLAQEVLVLDIGGYVGESTSREIDYAKAKGKRIRLTSEEAPLEVHTGAERDLAEQALEKLEWLANAGGTGTFEWQADVGRNHVSVWLADNVYQYWTLERRGLRWYSIQVPCADALELLREKGAKDAG